MNLRDENFKDAHLQKALRHAPDNDIAPNESTQKAVLDYADNALKLGQKPHAESHSQSWHARLKKAINAWQLPRWQLAGMGSLAASLLVVVMIWHENPDESILDNPVQVAAAPDAVQRDAAPSVQPELTQNELVKEEASQAEQSAQTVAEAAPVVASADSAAPNTQAKVIAKSSKQEAETAPTDKTVLAAAPEGVSGQVPEKDVDSTSAKEAAVKAEVALPAPVAAAPAAASVEASAEVASTTEISSARKKMADAEQPQTEHTEAKADLPKAITAAKQAVPSSNSDLAMTLGTIGGQALANKDIQTGRLRILYLSNEATNDAVDEATGYRKEAVLVNEGASEKTSLKSLVLEVEAYNKTMRDWHKAQH